MPVGINHFVFIGTILFGIGLYIIIANRNIIKILFGIILVFTASIINFAAFSNFVWFNPESHIIIFAVSCVFILLLLTGCITGFNFVKKYNSFELDINNND
jgi:NADH:ubiquinone oxidoreductase subunit K